MTSISIIVPIYNMEKLMHKCIDSILAQTFKDFELLLIDDGSTDRSAMICDDYQLRDSRVKAYHKANGGLSDARNYGLERATGKYTIFVDPDDWVDSSGLDKLYERAEKEDADITICDLYREDEYARHYMKQQPSSCNSKVVLEELFQHIGGFTVNKLIKRELYALFDIHYPVGIYGCEDQYVMAQFLKHDLKIAYEPVAFYHYMYNSSSLTRHYDEKTYQMDQQVLEMFSSLLQETSALPYAVHNKSGAVFTRAFWNGQDYYSSGLFQQRFKHYISSIGHLNEPAIVKLCMWLSCKGYYRFARRLVYSLFKGKQKIKKMLFILTNTKWSDLN